MRRSTTVGELRLGVESLEDRMLLAGTVKIAVHDGELTITGDKRDNCVEIETEGGEITIEGCHGTNIRGEIGNKTVHDVDISMGKGDDEVNIHDVDFDGDVSIHMNEGRDVVEIDQVNVDGDLHIQMGKDDDELSIRRSSADDVAIDGKDQDDVFDDRGDNDFDDFDCDGFEHGC
jgi:hypothetical protein